jgi:hypothetical protein
LGCLDRDETSACCALRPCCRALPAPVLIAEISAALLPYFRRLPLYRAALLYTYPLSVVFFKETPVCAFPFYCPICVKHGAFSLLPLFLWHSAVPGGSARLPGRNNILPPRSQVDIPIFYSTFVAALVVFSASHYAA